MISQETIEQVRQATDIVQVIGEYIKVVKRGRRFLALCPFHTEKTPSFSISPDKQLYYCFGCGRGGTVFNFLMEHEGMSFTAAVRFLAAKANIPIREDKETDHQRKKVEKIAYANQVALEYFQKQLFSSKYRDILQKYLIAKRGIQKETVETFALGLAGEEWEGLITYAKPKGLSPQDLTECGLASYSERAGKYYDRFRQRLMIPIFNLSQKPIAFGGRTLKKGEPAKYINSPETALYHKGNILYGLNLSKDVIKQQNAAIIVEGYFDVISLWQAGIQNVVASSGTAFTPQQARLLARFADEVFLFFDADSAGRTAAIRSVDVLFDAGLEVKVIVAPQGEDPDSIAREHGAEYINKLVANAIGYIQFRIRDVDLKTTGIIGREKLVKELGGLGNKIHDPTRRSLFHSEAARALEVDVQLLQNITTTERTVSPTTTPPPKKKYDPVEHDLLSLLFNNPGIIDETFEKIAPDDFTSPELSRLYAAMAQQYRSTSVIDAGGLIDKAEDNNFVSIVTAIASKEWDSTIIDSEAKKMLEQFITEKQKRIRLKLRKQLEEAEAKGDKEEAERIIRELKSYGL